MRDNSSQWRTPSVPGTDGTKWRCYCGIKHKTAGLSQGRVPVCPRNGSRFVRRFVPGTGPGLSQERVPFVPGKVPVCRRRRPAQTVYVYWFFTCLKTRTAIYRSLQAFRARNPEKVSKKSPPPGPECPKSLETSREVSKKCPKETFPRLFWDFLTLLRLFGHSGPGGSGRFFWDFLGISGPEGLETPVNGRSRLNACLARLWIKNFEKGGIREWDVAEICCRLHAKIAQHCWCFVSCITQMGCKLVIIAHSSVNFRQVYANTPFPMPPSRYFWDRNIASRDGCLLLIVPKTPF